MLNQTQRKIWKALQEGKKPEQIIDKQKEGMSRSNVYKVIAILKREGHYDEVS